MTDRFEVSDPSPEAVDAYFNYPGSDNVTGGLRAAYAVDAPRLCRAEVERALNALRFCDDGTGAAYLAARFGEEERPTPPAPAASTAQGERCPKCGRWFLPQAFGQPTVSCCVLHPPGDCCHHFQTEVPAPPSEAPAKECLWIRLENGNPAETCRLPLGHSGPHFVAAARPEATERTACPARLGQVHGGVATCRLERGHSGDHDWARSEAGKFCLEHRVRDCSICAARGACAACGCAQCQDDRIWVRTQRDAPYPKVR